MKKVYSFIRLSARSLSSIRTLAVCGVLLSLKLVLNLFTINISALLKIGLAYLPIAAAGMLFGPVVGGTVGALGDLLGYFIFPTGPYFPGFTLSAFLSGFVYGLLLYRRPVKLWRTFTVKALITLLVSFLLNPLWLAMMYGKTFWAAVSVRALASFAELLPDTVVLYVLLRVIERCCLPQILRNES